MGRLASFGLARGYVDRALSGGRPVFEWLHRDAEGNDIPCEVRFIRLPSSKHRLIRASIIDIAARRQADTLAYGERRVLELIAANAPLERTLNAVVRLVEQLHPTVGAAVMRLEEERLKLSASTGLAAPVVAMLADLPLGVKAGACGAAASLGRQTIARDIGADSLWLELRDVPLETACARAARRRSSRRAIEFTARSTFTSTARAARRRRSSISPRGSRSFSALRFAVSSTRPRCATAKRGSARCSTTSSTAFTRPRRLARSCR